MPKAKRIQSSGSGLGTNISTQLGPAPRKRTPGGTGRGRGRSRNDNRSPLAIAAEMVAARKAADELNKDNDGGLMGLLGDIGSAGKKGLTGALDVIDTPRAALLALGSEIGEGLEGQEGGFSLDDFVSKTRDNYTFGEFLNDEVAQTQDWHPIARAAAGITGDILIDPLTWLAPGAKIAAAGAKGAAGNLLKAGADDLARAGLSAEQAAGAAARVAKSRTGAVLSDAERVAAGFVDDAGRVERGIYWNAPGTGRVARRLHIDEAIDKVTGGRYGLSKGDRLHTKQLRIGGGDRLSSVQATAMRPVAAAANRLTRSGKWANGADAGFKEMFRSGDPEVAAKGFHGMEAAARGRLQDKRFEDEFGRLATHLLHDAKKARISMRDLWLAAGGDGPALERISALKGGDEIVERTRALFDDMAIEANARIEKLGGRGIIKSREDYTPHFLSPEYREAKGLGKSNFPKKGKRASVEKGRAYGPGDDLFGTTLVKPAEHPQGWSVERQVDDVLREHGVDEAKWFIEDAEVAFPLYVKVLARRVGNEVTAGQLIEKGLGEFAFGYTAAGKAVVDARAKAFRMAEAGRRKVRMASEAVGDAADRLARGVSAADDAAAKATKATQDARTAVQDAAAALDEAGETAGAAAIREYAEHWEDLAERTANGLSRFIASASDDIDRTTLQVAGLQAEATLILDQRRALSDRLRRLTAQRDVAWERASRLWDEAAERLDTGKNLRAIDAEIEDAQRQISDINDMIDELGVGSAPRPLEAIQADLNDVVRLQRSLGGRLRAAKLAGDADAVRRLQNDIDTARMWSAGLKHERKTGRILDTESVELLVAGQDDITRLKARIANARTEAQSVGNDRLAMALAGLEERLPMWDASTQTLVSGSPSWTGGWYHGTPKGVDLVHGRSKGALLDSGLGLHLTDDVQSAGDFVARSAQGDVDTGFGGVAAFDVAAAPDEVVAYPRGGYDMDWIGNTNPNMDMAQSIHMFGTPYGEAKTEILDEMLTLAVREGVVDVDTTYDLMVGYLRRDGVILDDAELDDIYMGIERMIGDMEDGLTFREAASTLFTDTVLDPLHGRVGLNPDYDGLFQHWSRVGNWLMLEMESGLDPAVRNQITDLFKAQPHMQGKKALLYDHGWGSQEMILLDPTAARSQAGPNPLSRTYDDVRNEMRSMITGAAERAQRTAQSYDGPIVDATLDYESAARAAEANRKNLDQAQAALADQRKVLSARVRESLEQEVGYRTKAKEAQELADRVQQEFVEQEMAKIAMLGDAYNARQVDEARIVAHNTRQIATLEASRQSALADLAKWERSAAKWDGKFTALQSVHAEMAVDTMVQRGLRMFGASTLLPEDMVEVLTAATRLQEPGWLKKFLSKYDYLQNLWKGWATTSPGFLNRNFMGGVFNNYLHGVERAVYQRYLQATKGQAKGIWQEGYNAAREAGILTGGQSVGEVAARIGHGMSIKPWTTDFAPVNAVRRGSAQVENMLRGSLFMDVYAKTGGDVDAAIAAVNKYHFDYDDLSAAERSVMRRVVPFYTWTRKNLPLQLEMLARKPAAYNKFTIAKQNIEGLSAEEDAVPNYFGENFAVRLPWMREGGNVYYMPDLPFTTVGEALEPNQVIGNMSPFIKTPIELWAGKQFWQDIPFNDKHLPVSPMMTAIPGLMPALSGVGWATHNAQGQWVMKDRHLHAVTNWLPALGQARRLLPAESKYQERALTSWMSFFGAGLRTNTTTDKWNTQMGDYYKFKDRLVELEDLGFLEKAYQYPEQTPAEKAQAPLRAIANAMEDYQLPENDAENEELLSFG